MGEAKRKAASWVSLFEEKEYPKATIVRRPWPKEFRGGIRSMEIELKGEKGLLCYDDTCFNKIAEVPEVMVVFKPNARGPIGMTMAVCPDCMQKGEGQIIEVMRRFAKRHGMGPLPVNTTSVMFEAEQVFEIEDDLPGGMAVVQPTDGEDGPSLVLGAIGSMLKQEKLPNLMSVYWGVRNCHLLVDMLMRDFEELGLEEVFKAGLGFSNVVLKETGEAMGWHSWVEAGDFVVEATNGGMGGPIWVMRKAKFVEVWKLDQVTAFDWRGWRRAVNAKKTEMVEL